MLENEIEQNGWCEYYSSCIDSIEDEIISIANRLGIPVQHRKSTALIQKLSPTSSIYSYPNSLSSKHEYDSFPLHNDTAHWLEPCRYVVLACLNEGRGKRTTTIFDYKSLEVTPREQDILLNAPFRVSRGRNSFFSTILSKNREYIRYDPGCMSPSTSYGNDVKNIFSEERLKSQIKHIEWEPKKIIVIDNWRLLHGRSSSSHEDHERTLFRVLVS